jgi:hypothetical protein
MDIQHWRNGRILEQKLMGYLSASIILFVGMKMVEFIVGVAELLDLDLINFQIKILSLNQHC